MIELNILKSFKKENYFSEPFPHFIQEKSFNDHTYELLEKDYNLIIEYLKKKYTFSKSNVRLQINSLEFLSTELFKKTIWFDFINFHTSEDFFNSLLNIFEKDINLFYPNFKIDVNKKKVSKRSDLINNKKSNFVIDCQPGINTPNTNYSSVRGPHVDNPVELIGGLFYLKDPLDVSVGGDLNIFRTKNKIFFKGKAEVSNISDLQLVKKITYDKNHSIFFLNSLSSIHSVTKREPSAFTRNLTNFVIENYNNNGYFELPRKKNLFNIISRLFKKSDLPQ